MKRRLKQGRRQFQLKMLDYGTYYYTERITQMETALAKKPRSFQINLVGVGEMPADFALLIRSVLLGRSPKTRLITNARSSLQGGSVLVWLMGDRRLIRDDAKIFFRRAKVAEVDEDEKSEAWKEDSEVTYCDSYSEMEPTEGDYARVLELINEFLPVKELTGKLIDVPALRQFGLVENKPMDDFLDFVQQFLGAPDEGCGLLRQVM